MNKNKEKQKGFTTHREKKEEVVEKLLDEILQEDDYQKRFQLIQQLDLFTMVVHRIWSMDVE